MAFSSFLYVFTEMLLILSIAFVVICSLFLLLSIVATLVMFRRARASWYVENSFKFFQTEAAWPGGQGAAFVILRTRVYIFPPAIG